MRVVETIAGLQEQSRAWRADRRKIGFVPTMGALHEGHISLVRAAREANSHVVASVFVNPTQFGPSEDFTRYPRDETGDAAKLAAARCDLLYAPTVDEMYPPGFSLAIYVGAIAANLCGPVRPGHFAGAATVVAQLLPQHLP